MRSQISDATSCAVGEPITVCVQCNGEGSWDVELPGGYARASCETLDEACRVGYLRAAHARLCELVIRDVHQRVVRRERVEGHYE